MALLHPAWLDPGFRAALAALAAGDARTRHAAAFELARHGDADGALPHLAAAFVRDPEPGVRAAASYCFVELAGEMTDQRLARELDLADAVRSVAPAPPPMRRWPR